MGSKAKTTQPKVTRRKITDFTQDAHNANKGTERGLRVLDDSIAETGLGRSVLVDKNDVLIAGNKTVERSIDRGFDDAIVIETTGDKLVIVKRTDLDLADSNPNNPARKLAYYDNVASQHMAWDATQIVADIEAGIDLSSLFMDYELEALGIDVSEEGAGGDAGAQLDRADELLKVWQCERGQLWIIPSQSGKGEHRLLCGDSTNADDVARVMGGERAEICFTSPPYNAGVSAQLRGNTHLQDSLYINNSDNLDAEKYKTFLIDFTTIALDCSDFVFVNLQPLSGNKRSLIGYWFRFIEQFCDIAIWNKEHAAPLLAQRVMNSQFEFILIFSNQNNSRAVGTREFRGNVSNVYSAPPQRNNENADIHGATMPLHLPLWICETFTNVTEIVYDPFGGSGTTIVACEQLARQCRMIEIEPKYCAVILQRLADMGLQPQLA